MPPTDYLRLCVGGRYGGTHTRSFRWEFERLPAMGRYEKAERKWARRAHRSEGKDSHQKQTETGILHEMIARTVEHANISAERELQPKTPKSNKVYDKQEASRIARSSRTNRGRWWTSIRRRVGKRSVRDSPAPPWPHYPTTR